MNMDSLEITPELLSLAAEIDEFRGGWKMLQHFSPEKLAHFRHAATLDSVAAILPWDSEKRTPKDIAPLLTRSPTTPHAEIAAGYAEALAQILDHDTESFITEEHLMQLHHTLLKYSDKDEVHRGKYKIFAKRVHAFDPQGRRLNITFTTSSPFNAPFKVQKLLEWTQQALSENKLHRLLVIGIFVIRFFTFHPFQDGNERLSHILTTLLLLKAGYPYAPYSALESIITEDKENYYLALHKTQETFSTENPDWKPWLTFFLHALKKQKDRLAEKLYQEKPALDTLPELSLKIITLVQEQKRITIKALQKLTQANRNTLKVHLRQLVRTSQLLQYGRARATWYVLG